MSFPRVIFVWQKPRWRRMSFQGFPQILLRREGWPWRNRLSSISVIFPEIKPSALFLSIRPGFCSACSGAAWCWQHDIDTSGKREKDCDALKSWEKGKLVTTLTGRGARCPAPPPIKVCWCSNGTTTQKLVTKLMHEEHEGEGLSLPRTSANVITRPRKGPCIILLLSEVSETK